LHVTSCSRADQILDGTEFDLAVLDYEMPIMNGCELARQLKRAKPGLKVILYTGTLNIQSHELSFVDQLVCKGEGFSALLVAVKLLLSHALSISSEIQIGQAP
jgi:CheY-like chemotaxis protein